MNNNPTPKRHGSEQEGREQWVPDPEDWRCDRCGEVVHSLGGMVYSHGGDGTRFQGHFNEEACEAEKRVDYGLAFTLAHQRLIELSREAWAAFTEIPEEQWEALPEQVRGSLTGLYVHALDGSEHKFYEPAIGKVEPVS